MKSLDEYLTNEYLTDQQELVSVERSIEDAAKTLLEVFSEEKGWGYRIRRGDTARTKEVKEAKFSQSTTAMVALSLFKLFNMWTRPVGFGGAPPFRPPATPIDDIALKKVQSAAKLLSGNLVTKTGVHSYSGTFGSDDPLTLAFVSGLLAVPSVAAEDDWKRVAVFLKRRCNELRSRDDLANALVNHRLFFPRLPENPRHEIVSNAFIPLRIVQTMRGIEGTKRYDLPEFQEYFESNLHTHLSFSSIPDSRFDPAELTFCLEGLLLSQRAAIDQSLFARVLEVLSTSQRQNAFWRPTKPFLATERGTSLFPISVEVANSLLRSCEIFDGTNLHNTFGSANIELFRRYWQWIRARTITFTRGAS